MTAMYAGIITLVAALLLTVLFFFLLARRGPKREASEIVPKVYKVRGMYFWALLVAIGGTLAWTLQMMPYPWLGDAKPTMTYTIIGKQWAWQTVKGPFDKSLLDSPAFDPIVVPAGETVSFHVTAADVTHGFGIYTPEGKLESQVQAMPGYVNELIYTFEEPGVYQIICMEYCGVAHHVMLANIQVTAAKGP